MSRDQQGYVLLKGECPPFSLFQHLLTALASCRSDWDALCFMGTSVLRDSGREERVCPLLFLSYLLPSESAFFGVESLCFPIGGGRREGRQRAMLLPPFSSVRLQLCGTALGMSPGGLRGCFSLLPPPAVPLLLLAASLHVLSWGGQGSRRAPSPVASVPARMTSGAAPLTPAPQPACSARSAAAG